MMSLLKIYAVYTSDNTLTKFLFVQTALCLAYLLGQHSAVSHDKSFESRTDRSEVFLQHKQT